MLSYLSSRGKNYLSNCVIMWYPKTTLQLQLVTWVFTNHTIVWFCTIFGQVCTAMSSNLFRLALTALRISYQVILLWMKWEDRNGALVPSRWFPSISLGPLGRKQNKYLLVVVCCLSKYVLTFPMRRATAEGVVKHYEDSVFSRPWCPSDNFLAQWQSIRKEELR